MRSFVSKLKFQQERKLSFSFFNSPCNEELRNSFPLLRITSTFLNYIQSKYPLMGLSRRLPLDCFPHYLQSLLIGGLIKKKCIEVDMKHNENGFYYY